MDREGRSDGSCYYSVLGILPDASFSDIRSAYRKLALKWHPDRWVKSPSSAGEASRRFQKIQGAYSVLSDQGKRSMYDAGLLDLLDEDEGMNDFMHDLFSMMDKQSQKTEGESLADLQRTFVDLFGEDLVQTAAREDRTVRKREWDGPTNVHTTKHSKYVER